MAFNVSNQVFDEVFNDKEMDSKEVKSSKEIIELFLKNLQIYLKNNSDKSPAYKVIGNWLEKGGTISSFSCRSDMISPMMKELNNHSIPFILLEEKSGQIGFLIRTKDNSKQRKLARHLLKEYSTYFRVVSGDAVDKIYREDRRFSDKGMVSIGNVTKDELLYLELKCADAFRDHAIGVDKMQDGTYLLSVHGLSAVNGHRPNDDSFLSTLVKTIFLFNSEAKKKATVISREVQNYRQARTVGFLDQDGSLENPVWIVGGTKQFIKRTINGFEFCHAVLSDDDVMLETDLKVPMTDSDYEDKLNNHLLKIPDKKVLYRLSDVVEHFKNKKNFFKTYQVSKGDEIPEKIFIDGVNELVADKVNQDALFFRGNNWTDKIKYYANEVSRVIVGVRDGKVPAGYLKQNILSLMNFTQENGMNLRRDGQAIDKLMDIEVYNKTALRLRVRNLEEHLAKFTPDKAIGKEPIDRNDRDR